MFVLPADRAMHFGDGVFTTALVQAGKIQLMPLHKQRMAVGLDALSIKDVDLDELFNQAKMQVCDHEQAVLKLVVSRGAGGRGYSTVGATQPNCYYQISPYPEHYAQWQRNGIDLIESPIRLGCNPALAGIKHLNRLEQVLIRQELDHLQAQEAIVLDSQGQIVEGCSCNLFWLQGDTWFTPDLSQAGVKGVMRRHLLNRMAAHQINVECVSRPLDTLLTADALLICNSLLGIVPVNQFKSKTYQREPVLELREII